MEEKQPTEGHTFSLYPGAEHSPFEIENSIRADIELVNSRPDEDPELTHFLNYLSDIAAEYREGLTRGVFNPMPLFKMRTMIVGRTKIADSKTKAHAHELVFEFNDRLKKYQGQDLRRFRRCMRDKCLKIFWADRLNKKFCSDRCLNAFTQSEYRRRAAEQS